MFAVEKKVTDISCVKQEFFFLFKYQPFSMFSIIRFRSIAFTLQLS